MEPVEQRPQEASMVANGQGPQQQQQQHKRCSFFQMPVHYPRYTRADYQAMPEWQLDCLLAQYGLPVAGDVDNKRAFAVGAFVWPSH